MSEQDDSALSRVSISTGVIPFPSLDSSLLPQTLSALEKSSNPGPGKITVKTWWRGFNSVHMNSAPSQPFCSEPMLRPSASSLTLPGILPFPTDLPNLDNGSASSRPGKSVVVVKFANADDKSCRACEE